MSIDPVSHLRSHPLLRRPSRHQNLHRPFLHASHRIHIQRLDASAQLPHRDPLHLRNHHIVSFSLPM